MGDSSSWDWEIGKRLIADVGRWPEIFPWVEEPCVSPDGEKIAAVVKTDEAAFSVCVNGVAWENTFDKIWYLRFAPDGRASAIVSDTGEWTLALDGEAWEERFDYLWNPLVAAGGGHIVAAAQKAMKYFAVMDGVAWESGFGALNNLRLSPDGRRAAAVVQTVAFNEGEIFKFQEGCYTVAVDGKPWVRNFVNVWGLDFSPDGRQVAAEVRTSLYDYTIVVDGEPWRQRFNAVWEPRFHPQDGTVSAPVKIGGSWTLAHDGERLWSGDYVQLWHQMYSLDGRHLAAIVAPKFGKWTVAVDDRPWSRTFGGLLTDARFSPDGGHIACAAKENDRWTVVVDGRAWDGGYDMVWQPVFSPDGRHVAAKVEKNGGYRLLLDGQVLRTDFDALWDPCFSPDGGRLLVRGLGSGADKGRYYREVVGLGARQG